MRHARNLFLFIFCLSLFATNHTIANDDFDGEVLSSVLEIREEDRYLVYGEYAEVEITASEAATIEFSSEVVPFGLELEKTSDTTYILFGRSEFLGKLCFLVDTTKVAAREITTERLCLYSEENEELNYPIYITKRFLDSVKVSEYSVTDIEIWSGDAAINYEVISGLPQGLTGTRSVEGENSKLTLSGSVATEGVYEIIVKSTEVQTEVSSYKQFLLEVTPAENTYQCGPGYYYDDYLGHCVQTGGSQCGEGTFYDISSGQCVAYRTNVCRAGRYFDHWQNRCVRLNSNRCPINYEWDGYYNRCTRLPYTCSIGQRYDYRRGYCVSLYQSRMCGYDSHWSTYRQRCVSNARACIRGNYWNGRRCISSPRSCRAGRYFDPISRRCIGRHVNRYCGPRSVWNHRTNSCNTRRVWANRTCRAGSRYSRRTGSCVGHNPTRINRHPRRPHRQGPVTRPRPRPNRPTTRPTPRPNRPTTRPRPRPNRPTTRPTPRPNRPTTRPTPRPNRPTTRPTPRPNRPTTRPTPRPNRPTTRPTPRPNRPTTRPTPRPNRPTTRPTPRPNRPTTRPTPRPNRPTTRPTPRPNRPTTRPTPRPSRPTTRPTPRPSRPTTRPTPRPSRPTTRPAPRPSRPSRSSGGTARPSRPSRSSGGTARPSRPSRSSGGSSRGNSSRRRRGN